MKPSIILRNARKLVEAPSRWWQDTPSGTQIPRDKHCAMLAISRTVRRVASGALSRRAEMDLFESSRDYLTRAIPLSLENFVSVWNDARERQHSEVVAAFDRAIALAESEGQ